MDNPLASLELAGSCIYLYIVNIIMNVHNIDIIIYQLALYLGITKNVMLTDGHQSGSARWWAQRLDNYLRSKLSDRYQRISTTEHGVQFRVTLQDGSTMKCDLLMSPWWRDQEELLQYFSGQAAKGNLNATLRT